MSLLKKTILGNNLAEASKTVREEIEARKTGVAINPHLKVFSDDDLQQMDGMVGMVCMFSGVDEYEPPKN